IDQDVDGVGMDQLSRLSVCHFADVDKAIEALLEAPAHRTPVIRAVGVSDDLKAAAVMALNQPGEQKSRRMLVEIRREIAEPDPLAQPRLPATKCGAARNRDLGSNPASAVELFFRG